MSSRRKAISLIVAAPLLLAGRGLISVGNALSVSNALGSVILALVGYLAGVVSKEPFARRLILAVGSAALGFAVVSIEFAVHH